GVQLVGAYSALANGGMLMEPRLVAKITSPDGNLLKEHYPSQVRRVLSAQTAETVRGILQRVVTEGTGLKAQIRGYSVAGKTGTAKKIELNGKYSKDKFVASFCGFVPASKPKYTILVAVSEPKTVIYGGQVAAPAFAQIAKNLLSMNAVSPDMAITDPIMEHPRSDGKQAAAKPAPAAQPKSETLKASKFANPEKTVSAKPAKIPLSEGKKTILAYAKGSAQ
ncbi:MAG TPA: penicillin-binding transpeptidase domain-containing protein, partial [Elusimicrobiales bacterium]|nr:penicillin-binding transpeptidase domain-containing protein [Elusimicrobiales bacterium]